MMRVLVGVIAFALQCGWLSAAFAQGKELVFGVYPYLTPTQIVEQYLPLKEHIARSLGQPVTMLSAPDFATFIERTRKGEYDIVFTAPHMGRLAEKRDGYKRVAQTGYQIVVALVCLRDAPIKAREDLKGRSVAIGSRMSMTYQVVDQALRQKGLSLENGVRVIETASFSNVMQATLRGEADVGAVPTAVLDNAPAEQQGLVREFFRTPPTPGGLVMAHPRLDMEKGEMLRSALTSFKDQPEGRQFFARSRLVDFRAIDDATMRQIDPFVAVLTGAN
ncbi:MAG: phosphate/phosphite/phosphonate ABC transporter substrate-binding protein [Gammaproteobacteria bacterium]|nr:phosphate/phosphite/phosphonate ABC transporter substrate-binding protein [Gammaproteobacteria bacterium]MBU1646624.1 phosphate/phosphite/phosphonate ABC transporter substrate-binding protein [Gammaproteobacteria bacterium]MBU1972881.1 phosphate/phosphite/phosphonate ABC transporter substrate-binding protein [Gammaproteobacteria bacterium]